MIFKKINEIVYSGWLSNLDIKIPFERKPVGIIEHTADK